MVWLSVTHKDATQTRLALEELGSKWNNWAFQDAATYEGVRAWAQGKGPEPFSPARLVVSKVGWEEAGKLHEGTTVPARKGVRLRVELSGSLPPGRLVGLREVMTHPTMTPPDGVPLSEHASDRLLYPTELIEPYVYTLADAYELVPGSWDLTFSVGKGAPLASAHFTLK